MRKLLVVAGPSAVGKTTVSDEIIRQNPKITLSRSATTRAPRGDEHDSEYVYMTREEFASAIASGDILEHTEYSGELYGTPRSEIERILGEGGTPLLILDLAGVASLRASSLSDDALFVYLYDELNTLEERLYARYMTPPSIEGLTKFVARKEQNISDYLGFDKHADLFDVLVSNAGEVADAAAKILAAMKEIPADEKSDTVAAIRKMAEDKMPKN